MNYFLNIYLCVPSVSVRAPCTNFGKTKSLAKLATDTVLWQFWNWGRQSVNAIERWLIREFSRKLKVKLIYFRLTDLITSECDGGIEGAFLNESFNLFAQFKRNGLLAQNGQSLKHTLDRTEIDLRAHLTDLTWSKHLIRNKIHSKFSLQIVVLTFLKHLSVGRPAVCSRGVIRWSENCPK